MSNEKDITRGFQLLSAYHQGTVGKSGYQEMHKSVSKNDWMSNDFFDDAEDMKKLLFSSNYFSTLRQWSLSKNKDKSESFRYNIRGMLSEFSTIAFYIGLIKHHSGSALGGPGTTGSVKGVIFCKNAYALFDELIYEVINAQWGGAGDGKAESKIKKVDGTGANMYASSVTRDKWEKLWKTMLGGKDGDIANATSKLTVGVHPNTEKEMAAWQKPQSGKPQPTQKFSRQTQILMLHYYATMGCGSPRSYNASYKNWHWDHIIPQSDFKKKNAKYHIFCNNIANCQALPTHANQLKSDNILKLALNLTDAKIDIETKALIEKYSGIKRADYAKYSKAEQAEVLVRERGARMMKEFLDARDAILI